MKFKVEVPHPNRDATLTVEGNYTPGRAMRQADMHQPGEPAEPAEIEVINLTVDDGPQPLDDDWADLIDAIYEDVLIVAEEQLQSEHEAAQEDWAEGRREMQREEEL